MPGLTDAVHQILDRRLAPNIAQPLAIALSGGGDSVALAHMAKTWAQANGRRLLCLTVDHRLNPASRAWTARCGELAAQLGADFQALSWDGAKPSTGLPAAARSARHALLAEAARRAGASVILMGHTASDLAETVAMRQAGSSTPDPREWAPSPAWPQGRGVFLLRPMLGLSRLQLRQWLTEQGAGWIDDPANEDLRFARSRARHGSPVEGRSAQTRSTHIPEDLALSIQEDFGLRMPREALRSADPSAANALVGVACVCAGGGVRLPNRQRLIALTEALCGVRAINQTLAGAQILADQETIRWVRPAGEILRSHAPDLNLAPGEVGVWDGRYEVRAGTGVVVGALAGHRRELSKAARDQLGKIPAQARGAEPWVRSRPGSVDTPQVEIVSLALNRFQAAAGLIAVEPQQA